jgi:hypothetical protein
MVLSSPYKKGRVVVKLPTSSTRRGRELYHISDLLDEIDQETVSNMSDHDFDMIVIPQESQSHSDN